GDEDTGSMAAWYVLSALGVYPACPGKAEYTLGSPLFPRATLHLAQGKTLVIEAEGNGPSTVFVQGTMLDGEIVHGPTVTHDELMRGGTLHRKMISQV
ncbi:MAG TPA: glycoside hydrolase domain-containing protein, partial [Acidobacteriaceae bacterium]